MSKRGGKRENAGIKRGFKYPQTLEKTAVLAEFRQRTMRNADRLFNAQFAKAVGSVMVYRVDEFEDENGKKKKEHVLVTDADEIKSVLDENEGTSGSVGENYYLVTTVIPDNKAIDSMLDRTFGKAQQTIEVIDENTTKWNKAVQDLIDSKAATDETEAKHLLESVGFNQPVTNLGNVG